MSETALTYFRMAQELNEECSEELKARKLHFRGNMESFSLISLAKETPEQGKSGFKDKEKGRTFLENGITSLLAEKKESIERGDSRPTREKELQAWIINYAINHEHALPFSRGLHFLTSELAIKEQGKMVNDILAIDREGSLVVIELKSRRNQKRLQKQVDDFCRVIEMKKDFFHQLTALLAPGRTWNGRLRKLIVWPDANGVARSDWENVEEVRYAEKPGTNGPEIVYDEKGDIVFS